MAARAWGLDALDGVFNDIEDDAGFERACTRARSLGFDGKTLIHPRQVEIANRTFAPSEAEVGAARRLVAFWEGNDPGGVARFEGRMVEELHVDAARRVLALADRFSPD